MFRYIPISELRQAVQEAYAQFKVVKDGANANYIPFLDQIPSDLFGISVCLPDGTLIEAGDTRYAFGIESVSKVPTAILAMQQCGAQALLEKIGADATGLPFNSIFAILLENDHPSTPLVNAGAISACSMVQPVGDFDKKWEAITAFFAKMCGSPLVLLEELYRSESETNYNNRAISWLLKNYDRIYDDPMGSLDIYTRQCSLGVTTTQLSIAAATMANGGRNPITGEQVFGQQLAEQAVSLVATVGFYERTGDWMYSSGLPAKTGVGGGIMGILPGVFGISAFSPPIDASGNSVRAQLALKYVMNKLKLSVYTHQHVEFVEDTQLEDDISTSAEGLGDGE